MGLKRAVDEVVIPAVAKANIRDRIAALTRRCLDAQKVICFGAWWLLRSQTGPVA